MYTCVRVDTRVYSVVEAAYKSASARIRLTPLCVSRRARNAREVRLKVHSRIGYRARGSRPEVFSFYETAASLNSLGKSRY